MPYRILCAYDHSVGAQRAFDFALDMARRYEGHLFVLCVFEPAEASRGVKQEALAETARHQFGAAVEALSNAGTAAGVPIVATIAIGSPAQQILSMQTNCMRTMSFLVNAGRTRTSAASSARCRCAWRRIAPRRSLLSGSLM